MPAEFQFLRPWWLLALLPLLAFLVWFARRRYEIRRWRGIVDPALMPHVLIGTGAHSRRWITVLLAVAGVLMITALAGPVWERMPQPVFRSQDALVIALDLSRSMDTADVKPSRLARARFEISDILERRAEGQTALIAYAAEPFVISPLTDDTRTIAAQLPALSTDLMPSQGSRADRALEQAAELLQRSGAVRGRVMLVTDGVDVARTEPVARKLRRSGIGVAVLGVGTAEGGPIPGPDGFVSRADGSIVVARLDATGLQAVAVAGGGRFAALAADESDIDKLLAGFDPGFDDAQASGLEADVWREEGPWLLLPLLPLAALAFRRGVIGVWLLLLVLPVRPATALEWSDLWSRPDQRASRALEAGDADAATELFDDPAWKGAAAYRAGRFEESAQALEALDDADAIYNRGNALARLGRYDEAIAAYEQVLERDADHNDARYNRDLLRELQQQSQPQQGGGESSDSSDDASQPQDGGDPQSGGGEQQDDAADSARSGQQESEPSGASVNQQAGEQADDDSDDTGDDTGDDSTGQDSAPEAMAASGNPGDRTGQPPQAPDGQADASATDAADGADETTGEESQAEARTEELPPDEEALAAEQWLRKIPDDPGGLLRRKFYYQYQQRGNTQPEEEPW